MGTDDTYLKRPEPVTTMAGVLTPCNCDGFGGYYYYRIDQTFVFLRDPALVDTVRPLANCAVEATGKLVPVEGSSSHSALWPAEMSAQLGK